MAQLNTFAAAVFVFVFHGRLSKHLASAPEAIEGRALGKGQMCDQSIHLEVVQQGIGHVIVDNSTPSNQVKSGRLH